MLDRAYIYQLVRRADVTSLVVIFIFYNYTCSLMLVVTKKLTFVALVKRAGFGTLRDFARELESHGFRKVSDNTLSAWKLGRYQPKLTLVEIQIFCRVLRCSIDELVDAFEQSDIESPEDSL